MAADDDELTSGRLASARGRLARLRRLRAATRRDGAHEAEADREAHERAIEPQAEAAVVHTPLVRDDSVQLAVAIEAAAELEREGLVADGRGEGLEIEM